MSAARGEHSGIDDRKETLADGHELSGWNHAVGKGERRQHSAADADRGHAEERVPFGRNGSGAGIVKLEPLFDLGRNFDREGRVIRRATGYRQHQHMRLAAFVFPKRGHNGARAVFRGAAAPFQMLAIRNVALPDKRPGTG